MLRRDKLLINEAKEKAMFPKDITGAIIESNLTFMRVIEIFGTFMTAVAQIFSKSLENMTRAYIVNDPPFYHQAPAPHRHSFQFHDTMHDRYVQNTRSFRMILEIKVLTQSATRMMILVLFSETMNNSHSTTCTKQFI